MNKYVHAITVIAVSAVALPTFAGPDFAAIEQARKARHAAQLVAAAEPATMRVDRECAARLVLPLDHGPRAVTTPYLNEKRKTRFEAQQRECEQARQAQPSTPKQAAG
jgi:hypothetical protein